MSALTPDPKVMPRASAPAARQSLLGLPRDAMRDALITMGTPERQAKMRTNQLWSWIYQKGAQDFGVMTNLAKGFRPDLSAHFTLERPEIVTLQVSTDGTRKYLLRIAGGHEVEMVYIPDENRGTLCISSQVGCTLNCSFAIPAPRNWCAT